MRVISKLIVPIDKEEVAAPMPTGGAILKCEVVELKELVLAVWILHDVDADLQAETFYVINEGQPVPDTFPGLFIDRVTFEGIDDLFVFFKPKLKRKPIVVNPNDPGIDADTRGAG